MKKALVVFLALAMIAGVFADEPVAESSVAKFSGEASVTWGVDLDTSKTGFSNSEKAELEIVFVKGGDKATSGEGVWGEIKIKTEGLQYKKANENNEKKNADWNGDKGFAEVDTAKLHLGPVYVGVRSGNTNVLDYNAPRALDYEKTTAKHDYNTSDLDKAHGIVIGYSAGDIFAIDVDFRSTKQYTNDYAVAAEVTSKPISGLEIKAGYSVAFNKMNMGAGFRAEYNMPIGDAGMYIKPGIGYVIPFGLKADGTNDMGNLAIGVLFGFSDETGKDNPGLPLFDDATTKKSNAGVSVATLIDLATNTIPLYFDVWTGSKLVPNLGAAAFFRAAAIDKVAENTLGFGVKYAVSVDPATITPQAGLVMVNSAVATDKAMNLKVGADISGAVANTTFSVFYVSGNLSAATPVLGKIDTHTMT